MEKVENKDKVMRSALVILVAVVVVFAGVLIFAGKKASPIAENGSRQEGKLEKAIVNVGGSHLIASVADSQSTRKQGLSGVHSIGPNEGKLFVFDEEGYWEFWTPDMNFDIDIIFINDKGTVVDIIENVSPDSYPKSFKPKYPASKVLETNANWAKTNNIKIGDIVLTTKLQAEQVGK